MANAHEIIPRLWLGNIRAATDTDFLHQQNISVVFNCTKDLPFALTSSAKYRLPVDDNLQPVEINNMELWAPETVMLVVKEYNRGSHILIHCAAGMQRSAAIMAMTLMVLRSAQSDDAIKFIRSVRPIAFTPEVNFRKSIAGFEQYYNQVILPNLDKKTN